MLKEYIIPINYIERKPDSDQYRIVDKGITVTFLASLLSNASWTLDRICQEYNLSPAEVHAAWSFYYDHQAEIDAHLQASIHAVTDEEHQAKAGLKQKWQAN
jgi:uncharacterized protein (DUF433 family)